MNAIRVSYRPLIRGERVRFFFQGRWYSGTIIGHTLDSNRKPGIGRVSYEVKTHPAFESIDVAATKVDTLEGPYTETYAEAFRRTRQHGGNPFQAA